MKLLSLLLSSGLVLAAQAQYKSIEPEGAECLEPAAQALLPYIIESKDDSRFQFTYDQAHRPEAISNGSTGQVYLLEGVWHTRPDEEFVQYGDDYEVFTALVTHGHSGFCEIIHLDWAKKF